jgi:hypothetical protein
MTETERAAALLGVSLLPVAVGTAEDLPRRFDEMTAAGADAYFVLNEPRTDAMRDDIAALALRHHLPGTGPPLGRGGSAALLWSEPFGDSQAACRLCR